jgi:hypothetical protein
MIYRLDEKFQQHQVTHFPLQTRSTFSLQGISYWVDENEDLWYKLDHDWLKETFYTEVYRALLEVKTCIQNSKVSFEMLVGGVTNNPIDNLHEAAGGSWVPSPSSDDSHGNTSSGPSSPTLSIGSDEARSTTLPQLSQFPDQAEIDNWFQQLKRCRAVQAKAGHRLQEVRCPLSRCGKVQRRPQALRDHLYFHFGIKRK